MRRVETRQQAERRFNLKAREKVLFKVSKVKALN